MTTETTTPSDAVEIGRGGRMSRQRKLGAVLRAQCGQQQGTRIFAGRSIDIGSTAGSAALLGRANGTPTKIIYV